ECLALDQLQYKGKVPIDFLNSVDRRDVRMIQRGEHPRLTLEAGKTGSVSGEGVRKNLDRDVAPEACIACAIDLSHAPRTQERIDAIGAELSPDQRGRGADRHKTRCCDHRRCDQKILSRAIEREQRLHLVLELTIAATCRAHKGSTLWHGPK